MKKKVLITGVNGVMGQLVKEAFQSSDDFEVIGGVDLAVDRFENPFPVCDDIDDCPAGADLLVDFSKPGALENNLRYARSHSIPIIIATTGYSEMQKLAISSAAKDIPVFYTANMSLGVNLQAELCKDAITFFGQSADVEIIEKHHNRKVDAPSGTAILLADAMNAAMDDQYHYQYGRYGTDAKRQPFEIGIHSVRGGNMSGDHEVSFIMDQEILTVSHHTESRRVFAEGALRAARFIVKQTPGQYSMADILRESKTKKLSHIAEDVSVMTIKNAYCTVSYMARLVNLFLKEGITLDMMDQSTASQGRVDISFTLKTGNVSNAEKCIQASAPGTDYMIQNDLVKYTVYAGESAVPTDKLDALFEGLKEENIDIIHLSMRDNTLMFITEKEFRIKTEKFIKEIF
ncbi:MAG: 4-hydroxy-tetrahydrodipicolinate reductase [Clostridia bacterium]|nr:4-hydroxy-tetrahydrodipicolinate reductase [Clostridia bacterium]